MKNNKEFAIAIALIFLHINSFAQQPNWQNLDLQKDGVFGISTEKAYKEFLNNKKAKTVIVAIIDSGVDTLQEDLRFSLWCDPQTGHHGWNFIGSESGVEDIVNLQSNYKNEKSLTTALVSKVQTMQSFASELESNKEIADKISEKIGKDNPTLIDFIHYKPQNEDEALIVKMIIKSLPNYTDWKACRYSELTNLIDLANFHITHGLNKANNEQNINIGNSNVSPDAMGFVKDQNNSALHGTHVAGIIGALRDNGIGMQGVADHVQLMSLKVMGTIREMRDISLAAAIRFAVDHGAQIINLSFGKPYTFDKADVDSAVQYAMKNNVLIVNAAGNDGQDLDLVQHYPSPKYAKGKAKANAWIQVGASGWRNDNNLAADFSNYGKMNVDVFAPGKNIYSTLPNAQYESWDGTSMAAPVVAGLAALIWEYYPNITAVQVKNIIIKTVVKSPFLKDKCSSSGVVNAYNALKLASTYK